jgi:DNA polymerase I
MNKYLIIDGSALLHRAYHALPMFVSAEGVPTNALHGFSKMALSLLERLRPTYFSVIFDTPKTTFRKKLVSSYQAQRPKTPDEFKVQVPLVQEFLRLAKLNYYFKEGFEADDVISTITNKAQGIDPELMVYIFTGDKDILQLVSKRTQILMPKVGVSSLFYMDEEAVRDKFGISPSQIVDFKALVGDASDNYQGVSGIGPKTAAKLLLEYKTIDNLYAQLGKIKPALREKLQADKQQAFLAKKLAQLVNDVEVEFALDSNLLNMPPLTPELVNFCDRFSLKSLKKHISRFNKEKTVNNSVDKQGQNQLSFF